MTVVTSIKNTVPSVSDGRLPMYVRQQVPIRRPHGHQAQIQVVTEAGSSVGKYVCRCLVIWSCLVLVCSLVVGFVYGISALTYILPQGSDSAKTNQISQQSHALPSSNTPGVYSVPKTDFCYKWCGQAFYYRYRCSETFVCPVQLPSIPMLDGFNVCYVVCNANKPVVAVSCENLLNTCD